MSTVARKVPLKAFDHIAKLMKDSAGPDGILSRKDAKALVTNLKAEGRETEALAAGNIFKMLDMRDANYEGARVTGRDLADVKSFVKTKMLDNRDVDHNGFSRAEIARMSATGKALVEIGKLLEAGRIGGAPAGGDAATFAKGLEKVAKDITFEGFMGNEGGDGYKAVSFPLPKNKALNAANVTDALNLAHSVKLEKSESTIKELIDYHLEDAQGAYKAGYEALGKALKDLKDVTLFVDANEDHVSGKVYILGRMQDGSVAGLQTTRIWT